MTVLMYPLEVHLGPISDTHVQTQCTELKDKLLWAPGAQNQYLMWSSHRHVGHFDQMFFHWAFTSVIHST